MTNTTEYELMTVDYTETDSEWPAICFCNDFIVAVSNISFVKSFLIFAEGELVFKLGFLSGNKLSFKVAAEDEESPEESILEVYFDKKPMGFVRLETLTNVMHSIRAQLQKIKEQSE